jgi:hypothetical protein
MKKFLFVLMAVCLTFAMIGCDKDKPGGDTTEYVYITYNVGTDNNAAPLAPETAKIAKGGSLAELPTLATWSDTDGIGFVLEGWYQGTITPVKISTSTTFNADTTVTAKWTETPPAGKAVVYVDLGYAVAGRITRTVVTVGATAPLLSTVLPQTEPSRTGVVFGGWFNQLFEIDADDSAATKYLGTEAISGETVYYAYAKWNYKRFNVTFMLDGTTAYTVVGVIEDEGIGDLLPANPTVANKEFFGWQEGAANTTSLVDWDTWTADATKIVYARWWSTELEYDPSDPADFTTGDVVEKVMLENQAFALYKFTIPAGKTVADYEKVTVDYKVPEATLYKKLAHYRLMGAYTDDQFDDTGTDGGSPYNVVTEDENGVFSIKLIAGSAYNGGFIVDNSGGNKNSVGFWEDESFAANTWKTMEYSIDGSKKHSSFVNDNLIPGKDPVDHTFYLGVGLASLECAKSGGFVTTVGEGGPIVQLIKNVTLVGAGSEPSVVGQIPVNTADEPMYVGYLTPITWNYRGDPEDPVAVPGVIPATIAAPYFVGWGDQGGKNGNSFDFTRTQYGSCITYTIPAWLLTNTKVGKIKVSYTLTRDSTVGPTVDMKLTFSPRANGVWSGQSADTYSPNHGVNGDFEKELDFSDYTDGSLSIVHNDGGNDGPAVKFNIKITKIEFTE